MSWRRYDSEFFQARKASVAETVVPYSDVKPRSHRELNWQFAVLHRVRKNGLQNKCYNKGLSVLSDFLHTQTMKQVNKKRRKNTGSASILLAFKIRHWIYSFQHSNFDFIDLAYYCAQNYYATLLPPNTWVKIWQRYHKILGAVFIRTQFSSFQSWRCQWPLSGRSASRGKKMKGRVTARNARQVTIRLICFAIMFYYYLYSRVKRETLRSSLKLSIHTCQLWWYHA